MTLQDRAKLSYAKNLQERLQCMPHHQSSNNLCSISEDLITADCPKGWALKSTASKSRFAEKQKEFLDSKYSVGIETGKKLNGEDV